MKTVFLVASLTAINLPFMLLKCCPFEEEIDKSRRIKLIEFYALILAVTASAVSILDMTISVGVSTYKLIVICVGILTTLVNILVIKNRVYEHLFTMGLSASSVYIVYTIVTFIQGKLMSTTDERLYIAVNAAACTVCVFPFFGLFRSFIRKTVTPFLSLDAKDFWKGSFFIPEMLFISSFLVVPTEKFITSPSVIIARLLIMSANVALCRIIARENLNIREKYANEEQMARQQEYYLALSESVTTMRRYRHDFKHHIAALNGFAEAGQFDEMKDYLRQMSITSDKETVINYTGRASADGLIYHYASVAEQENISFTVKGTFKGITIADTDLCVLLGNALENAVGGCRTTLDDRFITVEIKRQGELLAILVKNSFDGTVSEEEGKLLSRKRNKSKGIGLSSMEEMCKKYNGTFEARHEGTVFSVFLMLACIDTSEPCEKASDSNTNKTEE